MAEGNNVCPVGYRHFHCYSMDGSKSINHAHLSADLWVKNQLYVEPYGLFVGLGDTAVENQILNEGACSATESSA